MGKSAYDFYLEQLERKRAPAIESARALAQSGQYDEAIAAVRKVDDSIYGAVATAKLLEAHLRELVAAQPKADAKRLRTAFEHALSVAQSCYPEPHTQIEADNYDTGRAEDRARLIKILGYDPTA